MGKTVGSLAPFAGASAPASPPDGALWWDTDDATSVLVDGVFVGARVTSATAQTVGAYVATALTFTTEEYDTDGFHSTSVNPSRMTIAAGRGGKYLLQAGAFFPASTGGGWIGFYKNGAAVAGLAPGGTTVSEQYGQAQITLHLDAGDYVEVFVLTAVAMDIGQGGPERNKWFALTKLDVTVVRVTSPSVPFFMS